MYISLIINGAEQDLKLEDLGYTWVYFILLYLLRWNGNSHLNLRCQDQKMTVRAILLKLNQNIALPRIHVTITGNISDLSDHVTRWDRLKTLQFRSQYFFNYCDNTADKRSEPPCIIANMYKYESDPVFLIPNQQLSFKQPCSKHPLLVTLKTNGPSTSGIQKYVKTSW